MADDDLCPLCVRDSCSTPFFADRHRRYYRCEHCALVYAKRRSLPRAAEEKAIYDLHQNGAADPGYRHFLSRLANPLLQRLRPEQVQGLDFGCGPGPALAMMLEEAGREMSLFDPFYYPNTWALEQVYDFICCTEAIEHFHRPAHEWKLLNNLLAPDGCLAIMTQMLIHPNRFARWTYKNDPTHVSFFSRETFAFLAERDGFECEFVGDNVVLMQRHKKVRINP